VLLSKRLIQLTGKLFMMDFLKLFSHFDEFTNQGKVPGGLQNFCVVVPEEAVDVLTAIWPHYLIATVANCPKDAKNVLVIPNDRDHSLVDAVQRALPGTNVIDFFYDFYPGALATHFLTVRIMEGEFPSRGLLMFASPRSGTHYVGELLGGTGIVGPPREYLRPLLLDALKQGLVKISSHLLRCALASAQHLRHWSMQLPVIYIKDVWRLLDEGDQWFLLTWMAAQESFTLARRDRTAQGMSVRRADYYGHYHIRKSIDYSILPKATRAPPDTLRWMYWINRFIHEKRSEEKWIADILATVGRIVPTYYYEDFIERADIERNLNTLLNPFVPAGTIVRASKDIDVQIQRTPEDAAENAQMSALIDSIIILDLRMNDGPYHRLEGHWGTPSIGKDAVRVPINNQQSKLIVKLGSLPKLPRTLVVHFDTGDSLRHSNVLGVRIGNNTEHFLALPPNEYIPAFIELPSLGDTGEVVELFFRVVELQGRTGHLSISTSLIMPVDFGHAQDAPNPFAVRIGLHSGTILTPQVRDSPK
jgi:hypothetical protein